MKLAEALILRADHQKRVEQLRERLLRNAKVQEGDKPAEDPQLLIAELERLTAELMRLMQRINTTNSASRLESGQTITDALAQRDILQLKHAIYNQLAQSASVSYDRYTKSEVRYQSTVEVSVIQQHADTLAKEHRDLDALLQAANWVTDLIE